MPDKDGFEAAKIIHQTLDASLPIIALSADARKEEKMKAKEIGMTDYITKPVTINKLKNAIINWRRKDNKVG